MEFVPKYIKQVMSKRDSETVTAQEWNAIINLLIEQGDYNAEFLRQIAQTCSTTEEIQILIDQKVLDIGSADMARATYDANRNNIVDVAESVIDGSISANNLKDGIVSTQKLSEDVNRKMDYTYNNVSRLLILMGAQSEIEGSEDLVLFGLDGSLSSTYNATQENVSKELYPMSIPSGTTNVSHEIENITAVLNTTDNYSITNDIVTHRTKLTKITNAQLSAPATTQVFAPYQSEGGYPYQWLYHIEDDYYCIITECGSDNEGTKHMTVFVVRYDATTSSLIIVTSYNIGHERHRHSAKVGNRICLITEEDGDGEWFELYNITKSNISNVGSSSDERLTEPVFGKTGNIYAITFDNDDTKDQRLIKNGRQLLDCGDYVSSDLYSVSGSYAFLSIEDKSSGTYTYYWLNLVTGSLTTTNSKPSFIGSTTPDVDGDYFYYNKGRYSLDPNDFSLVKDTDIINLPTKFTCIEPKVLLSNNVVYRIDGNLCKPVYDLNRFNNTIQYNATQNYQLAEIAVNEDLSRGVMLFEVSVEGTSSLSKTFTFTKGSITLAKATTQNITGHININRQQICEVPANQTKHIFLKPKTDGNTFTNLDLIVYLDRALGSGDSLQVVAMNNTTNAETTLTALPSSGETTKYYEHVFATATSNIDIIVTLKAGSTPLKITQILGGVDNGI